MNVYLVLKSPDLVCIISKTKLLEHLINFLVRGPILRINVILTSVLIEAHRKWNASYFWARIIAKAEFVVNEIALAASKMLDKIVSIEDLNDENKYSDLLVLALDSRISLWGWSAPEQLRKGSSPQGKNPGEIDFDVRDFRKKAITTCEAFIFRSEVTTKDHIEKLLTKYTHDIARLVLIIYYKGTDEKF